MEDFRVTILGCGGAGGVPSISAGWGACDPTNPLNRRRRASILLQWRGAGQVDRYLLVDASPDFREQILSVGIRRLDALVVTHAHADHVHGLDDLREINRSMGGPLDLWAREEDLDVLEQKFGYCFTPLAPGATTVYKPILNKRILNPGEMVRPIEGDDLELLPFTQDHGWATTIGLRFGPFAYSTDVVGLDNAAFEALKGVDTWVVDCFGPDKHPTHAHVELVLEWLERVKPRQAILTHMGPGLDYRELSARLPCHVRPAFDGMVILPNAGD
ncbi:MBL fold metallo-hydrolase [Rhodospirillum sp. A1_3_36]|uniref:MBL fold metallo-hydrolase n=1 Tax=Rhodospirillum sp. A1_3_36 TaxID=3391666 RepID=UPI0039A5604F